MSTTRSLTGQRLTLGAFLAFQLLDVLTTHVGLALHHPELNRLMAPIIAANGELAAYAAKGAAVCILLAILMLSARRMPGIWFAYQVAAGLTALAVISNAVQLL